MTISNSDNIIDSREVIKRIEELEGDDCREEEEEEELVALRDFADEGENICEDWIHGEALIRDSYFEDHARELAEDIGSIAHGQGWPTTCIDWKQAAEELQMDYSTAEFDGVTYWAR